MTYNEVYDAPENGEEEPEWLLDDLERKGRTAAMLPYLRELVVWFVIVAAWSVLLWLAHTLLGNYNY